MMIHTALGWTDASEKILWANDMDNDVQLHNQTPNISSGMSLEELWTSYKPEHRYL